MNSIFFYGGEYINLAVNMEYQEGDEEKLRENEARDVCAPHSAVSIPYHQYENVQMKLCAWTVESWSVIKSSFYMTNAPIHIERLLVCQHNTKQGKLKGELATASKWTNITSILLCWSLTSGMKETQRFVISVVRGQFGDDGAHNQCMHDVGCVSLCEFGRSVSLHTGKSFMLLLFNFWISVVV